MQLVKFLNGKIGGFLRLLGNYKEIGKKTLASLLLTLATWNKIAWNVIRKRNEKKGEKRNTVRVFILFRDFSSFQTGETWNNGVIINIRKSTEIVQRDGSSLYF